VPQKSNIIPLRFNLPGIKKLLLPGSADTDLLDMSAAPARALFGPPTETAVAEKRSSLVDGGLPSLERVADLPRDDGGRGSQSGRRVHAVRTRRARCPGSVNRRISV